MTAPKPVDLAAWCAARAEAYREYEHVEMAAAPTPEDRDVALVEWTIRTLGNPGLAESREVLRFLAGRHEPTPARCPNCAPGYDCESGVYAPAEPLDLDALDALAAAATDGPWTGANYRLALAGLATSTGNHAADAEFIRAARTALPRLVAELRALQAERTKLADELSDRRREDLALRGLLSPQGELIPPVPAEQIDAGVVTAVQWLINQVRELTSRPTLLDWDAVRAERDRLRELVVKRERQVERLTAELAEATVKAAARFGPTVELPDTSGATPLEAAQADQARFLERKHRQASDGPDSPEAIEADLRLVAAATGETYETVRDLYDAMGACADEERIGREAEADEMPEARRHQIVLVDNSDYGPDLLTVLPHQYADLETAREQIAAIEVYHPSEDTAAWEAWSVERIAHEAETSGGAR